MLANPIERFSTQSASTTSRLAYWNDLASQTFNNLRVDAADPDEFQGEMLRVQVGDLFMMGVASAPACVSRVNDPTRNARGRREFDLHFQLSGRSVNAQAGREAVLEAGDFTLCDASQPYSVRFSEANHMICVKTPIEPLVARLGDLEDLVCRPMSARQGGAAMLSVFMRTLWTQLEQGGLEDRDETVSDVVLDLLTLAYRPVTNHPGDASLRASRRRQARAFIKEQLCDPDLDVATVAEAMGLSPRYLQILFAEDGATPSAYILDRRLDLAASRLRADVERGGVTRVALSVGFNDLTHFGRAFRKRFGVTPSEYTSGARASRWRPRTTNRAGILDEEALTV